MHLHVSFRAHHLRSTRRGEVILRAATDTIQTIVTSVVWEWTTEQQTTTETLRTTASMMMKAPSRNILNTWCITHIMMIQQGKCFFYKVRRTFMMVFVIFFFFYGIISIIKYFYFLLILIYDVVTGMSSCIWHERL